MGIGVEIVSIDKLVERHLQGLDAMIPKDDPGAPPSLYTYIHVRASNRIRMLERMAV